MANKMLVDAAHPEETRVVVLRGNRVEEFDFESASRKQLRGNIYLAKVTRVEPSLQAAFVDYGGNRHGFLAFSEIHPDYYQIPVADRQALIEAEEREIAEAEDRADAAAEASEHRRTATRCRRGRFRRRCGRSSEARAPGGSARKTTARPRETPAVTPRSAPETRARITGCRTPISEAAERMHEARKARAQESGSERRRPGERPRGRQRRPRRIGRRRGCARGVARAPQGPRRANTRSRK